MRHVSDGTPTKVSYELTDEGPRARARAGRAQDLGGPLVGLSPTARPPVTAVRSISLQRAMADRPQTPEDVKALVEEHGIRFVRLWFTDILGQLKSFSISSRAARRRLRGRHGLRRLLDHRLQRHRGVGHDRDARPDDVQRAALAAGGRRRRRAHVRRRPDARAPPVRGRPAPRAQPGRGARARRWASTSSTSAPSSSTTCSATTARTEVLDEGGYFDLTTLDAGSDVRRDTVLALERLGIEVEYSHHEVGPSPARDRHALRRAR